jgi:DNA-binding MarR family transcriptional regulator
LYDCSAHHCTELRVCVGDFPCRRALRGGPAATPADWVVLEIRKFITAAIFFNAQAAEKVGLSPTDIQMVSMLQLYGPSTPSRLGEATGLSSGGVTVALDRLEKAGYIRRQPHPSDRRSLLITLVPSAVAKLAGLYDAVESRTRRLLSTLPQRDLEAVIRFFETIAAHRMAGGVHGN